MIRVNHDSDFIQFIVLSIGMGIGVVICLMHPDLGWTRMITTLSEHRGEMAFNPFHPDSYGWLFMIWMFVAALAGSVSWAPEASRALTAKDPKTTNRTFLFAAPSLSIRAVIPAIVGQFIALFMDTTLAIIVGLLELLAIGKAVLQSNQAWLLRDKEVYLFIAVVFWIFTYAMSYASRRLETALGVGER